MSGPEERTFPVNMHGPFDIQGGGRAWVFGPGQMFFSDKIGARFFFAGPSPDYYFFS